MSAAIRVEGLSKLFRINQGARHYATLRESLVDCVRSPLRHVRSGAALGRTESFWALRDVNFDVRPGEVVGVVGRNGAGKSTLLKVISRITSPTFGRVELRGRVGSLLEVGTGFHPELTGRENTFLNGSILGMSRAQIQRQFDAIVEFSGVEKFLDTPVKRYSSGMRVRLAFAVAAHLDPEMLLVDEVLAVGDAAFQSKCLAKMGDVARSGRTVLFVSHNMAAVQNLCTRALLLEDGRLTLDDDPDAVVEAYAKSYTSTLGCCDLTGPDVERSGNGAATFERADVLSLAGEPTSAVGMGEGLGVRLVIRSRIELPACNLALRLTNAQGVPLCVLRSLETAAFEFPLARDRHTVVECTIPELNLVPGQYRLTLELGTHAGKGTQLLDSVPQALSFDVVPRDVYETGRVPGGPANLIFLRPEWSALDGSPGAWDATGSASVVQSIDLQSRTGNASGTHRSQTVEALGRVTGGESTQPIHPSKGSPT